MPASRNFWLRWLTLACCGVIVFGAVMVVAPTLTRQGFAWLLHGAPSALDAFGPQPVRYLGLAHAVIGAVMIGWGVALLQVTRTLIAAGDRRGHALVATSIAAWYLPDTAYSLLSGFWPNAVLNTGFLLLFVPPLWGLRSAAPAIDRSASALRA